MFVDLGHSVLAVLAFLGASVAFAVSLTSAAVALIMRRFALAKRLFALAAVVAFIYTFALFGFAVFSKEYVLGHGVEKHFCEVDCHIAYSVVAAKEHDGQLAVTVRTRFDETTISTRRAKSMPLTPNPREVVLVDPTGFAYAPIEGYHGQLEQPLKPGESYDTPFTFRVPTKHDRLHLYIRNSSFPNRWLIGHENSPGHKKVYFGLDS